MNRAECEKQIAEKLREIGEIHKQYNPDGMYLTLCISRGNLSFSNEHWEGGKDEDHPVDYFEFGDDEDEI